MGEISGDVNQHWFALTFQSATQIGTTYRGMLAKIIRLKDIKDAKQFSGMPEHSTLTGCSYLGYMSRNTFEEE